MKKLTVSLVIAFSVLWLAVVVGKRNDATERFTSAPLANGSRYTFLYPQQMKLRSGDDANCFLQEDSAPGIMAQLRSMLPGRRNKSVMLAGLSRDEIRVIAATQKPPFHNSWNNIVTKRNQYIFIEDAKSQTYCFVEYHCYSANEERFKTQSEILNRSFHVLAPGQRPPD